ncbi:MAG: hypothetical protein HND48_15295 [Chloroflexi bacterium]|nr:hypothetical protein [Chloroflexota bacterium]
MWHVSRRYRERDIVAEARSVFPEAIVARDFDHFTIKRGEGATRSLPPSSRMRTSRSEHRRPRPRGRDRHMELGGRNPGRAE